MSNRTDFLTTYLRGLLTAARTLQNEKTALQNAAARIVDINAELIDLRADAQAALDVLNRIQGTTLTLADIVAQQTGAT